MTIEKRLLLAITMLGLIALLLSQIGGLKARGTHPANMACDQCHLARGEITAANAGLLIAGQEQLCRTCHPNAVTASHPSGIKPGHQIPADFPLDWKGEMTCSTCHDIHGDEIGLSRVDMAGKALCLSCHDDGFFQRMKDGGMSILVSGHLDARAPLAGNIDTFSIQCLSCHETLGDDLAVRMSGNVIRHGSDRGNHPVGMMYQRSISYGGYRSIAQLPKEIALPNGRVSCISCHHGYSEQHGQLVMSNLGSRLCFSCHDI